MFGAAGVLNRTQMPPHYFMDLYYRPAGQREAILWKATRVVAQDDADAIRKAEASFESLARNSPLLTGFSLRRQHSRSAASAISITTAAAALYP